MPFMKKLQLKEGRALASSHPARGTLHLVSWLPDAIGGSREEPLRLQHIPPQRQSLQRPFCLIERMFSLICAHSFFQFLPQMTVP